MESTAARGRGIRARGGDSGASAAGGGDVLLQHSGASPAGGGDGGAASREDAEDLGKAVTESLAQLILKRGERK